VMRIAGVTIPSFWVTENSHRLKALIWGELAVEVRVLSRSDHGPGFDEYLEAKKVRPSSAERAARALLRASHGYSLPLEGGNSYASTGPKAPPRKLSGAA
jgi:hypothetical protein